VWFNAYLVIDPQMNLTAKKTFIWFVVAIISLLLVVQLVFSYRNSIIIEENLAIRRQAQQIKVKTLDIIRTTHELDIGLRGYALIPMQQLADPYDSAQIRIKSVFATLESELQAQDFDMRLLQAMQDSVNAYFRIADVMFEHLKKNKREEFLKLLEADYGYNTWLQYNKFSNEVNKFEDAIIDQASKNYETALKRNYLALLLLIALVVPTLIFTAIRTIREYKTSEQLRISEAERNKILASQNETLEKQVALRTEEIATQNEEILANLEFISERNQQLEEAKKVIEEKNRIIETRNQSLGQEVEKKSGSLRESNLELIKNINQLEQFSYTVSHNLRSPVARLIGLSNILQYAKNPEETKDIMGKITNSTHELDLVMKDLVRTIEIKKEINNSTSVVAVDQLVSKVVAQFEEEIKTYGAEVRTNVQATILQSIPAYIESMLFNLVSNSIKYRHPQKPLSININSRYEGEKFVLMIEDNGLGIDLDRHKRDLFSFYKRFHQHVEGRGLGLYLVKSQVELLGGTIDVSSVVDHGTTFTITLKHNLPTLA
jgi:K+-sensing histidine kinase KdpD